MKYIIIALLLILTATDANAGKRCSTNYWGDLNCKYDGGVTSTTRKDYWGDTRTTYSNGYEETCSTDYWGDLICH